MFIPSILAPSPPRQQLPLDAPHFFNSPLGVGLALSVATISLAEDAYPAKPIKVVVPFGVGGGSDTFVRVVQLGIEQGNLLPESAVVLNVGGAGGTIGSYRVKNTRPDGYTILNLHEGISR